MLSTERKLYLLQKVEREGTIHVRDVAKQLNISETTIRRDLMELGKERCEECTAVLSEKA